MTGTSVHPPSTPFPPRGGQRRRDRFPGRTIRYRPGASRAGFEQLLRLLGPDEEAQIRRYHEARQRLVATFNRRRCLFPEDLADEVLERAARRLESGVRLEKEDPARYLSGIAFRVYQEHLRARHCAPTLSARFPVATCRAEEPAVADGDTRLACLEQCLACLADGERRLVLAYYQGEDAIGARQELCRELGIPANALRLRAFRIRRKVEAELRSRLAGGDETLCHN